MVIALIQYAFVSLKTFKADMYETPGHFVRQLRWLVKVAMVNMDAGSAYLTMILYIG